MRAVAMLAVIAASLAGCETIDRKSTRPHATTTTRTSGPPATHADSEAARKPAGGQPTATDRASDGLVGPEYYYGSGRVGAGPLGRPGVTTDDAADTVSLNFVETGILEVVDVVLSKTLGLNYVIDARVQGTVTARTSKPIPRSAVLPVLENILALNGAAMVEAHGVYNIVPVGAVASLPKVVVTPSRHPQRQGVGIHVIPLEFASVASVRDIVASLVSPGHQLAVDHARNILIYTGPAQEARAIAEMVAVLDVDVLAGMSFALFPVQSSDARDVAGELEALVSEDAVGALGGVIRVLPIGGREGLASVGVRKGGERGAFVEGNRLAIDGALPMNTDGGGLSSNHPGMRGIFLIIEAVKQLRGDYEGTARQVKDCKISLCHGTGGMLGSRHSGETLVLGRD